MAEDNVITENAESPSGRFIKVLVETFGKSIMAPTGGELETRLGAHGYQKLTLYNEQGSVNIVYHQTNDAAVELYSIIAVPSRRGLGTKALELLTEAADKFGVTLWLDAAPLQAASPTSISTKKLRSLYESFWFDKVEIPDAWMNSYRKQYQSPMTYPMVRKPRGLTK